MTFEQATEELSAKLPADVEFTLLREASGMVRADDARRVRESFELVIERIGVGQKTFDVRDACLADAVAAAIDYARTAEVGEADEQAAADERREEREAARPDCSVCGNTGYARTIGAGGVESTVVCPACDRGIPF